MLNAVVPLGEAPRPFAQGGKPWPKAGSDCALNKARMAAFAGGMIAVTRAGERGQRRALQCLVSGSFVAGLCFHEPGPSRWDECAGPTSSIATCRCRLEEESDDRPQWSDSGNCRRSVRIS